MPTYRTKAVEVDAFRWTGMKWEEDERPKWLEEAIRNRQITIVTISKIEVRAHIRNGDDEFAEALPGDYLIRFPDGRIKKRTPDEFAVEFELLVTDIHGDDRPVAERLEDLEGYLDMIDHALGAAGHAEDGDWGEPLHWHVEAIIKMHQDALDNKDLLRRIHEVLMRAGCPTVAPVPGPDGDDGISHEDAVEMLTMKLRQAEERANITRGCSSCSNDITQDPDGLKRDEPNTCKDCEDGSAWVPRRIPRVLDALRRAWERDPEQTLGQLIENVRCALPILELYTMDDDEMERRILEYREQVKDRQFRVAFGGKV